MKNSAEIHSPKIVNNEVVYVHLCRDCADKKNSHEIHNGLEDKIQYLLDGFLQSQKNAKSPLMEIKCNVCGTTLEDLKKKKMLGCARCYKVFSHFIAKDIKNSETIYKKQKKSGKANVYIENLRGELKKAVAIENFEKAAELRDKIRKYEKEGFFRDN
jgi:protein arginine kinase activator